MYTRSSRRRRSSRLSILSFTSRSLYTTLLITQTLYYSKWYSRFLSYLQFGAAVGGDRIRISPWSLLQENWNYKLWMLICSSVKLQYRYCRRVSARWTPVYNIHRALCIRATRFTLKTCRPYFTGCIVAPSLWHICRRQFGGVRPIGHAIEVVYRAYYPAGVRHGNRYRWAFMPTIAAAASKCKGRSCVGPYAARCSAGLRVAFLRKR